MTIITFGGGRGVTTEPKVSFIIIYLTLSSQFPFLPLLDWPPSQYLSPHSQF